MGIEALALGGLIGAAGLGGSALQSGAISEANERNVEMQKFINAQNERLTREAWSRDDNAVQRRRADMRAAGINPNLAAGSPAATSQPARMEAAKVAANTAMGEGVASFGRNFSTAVGMDAAINQTRLTKEMVNTEQARYVSELAKSQKDLATAANMTSNAALKNQLERIARKDANLWTNKNIDVRDKDAVSKIMKQFPNAGKSVKKIVGENFPALSPYINE